MFKKKCSVNLISICQMKIKFYWITELVMIIYQYSNELIHVTSYLSLQIKRKSLRRFISLANSVQTQPRDEMSVVYVKILLWKFNFFLLWRFKLCFCEMKNYMHKVNKLWPMNEIWIHLFFFNINCISNMCKKYNWCLCINSK